MILVILKENLIYNNMENNQMDMFQGRSETKMNNNTNVPVFIMLLSLCIVVGVILGLLFTSL